MGIIWAQRKVTFATLVRAANRRQSMGSWIVDRIAMNAFLDRVKERTGIYKLGFDPASIAGIGLPVGFVIVVGGILAFLVMR